LKNPPLSSIQLLADRQVRCPALIMQGATDAHVPLRSAENMAAAMRAAGNGDVTVRIFPGVSHALLPDPLGMSTGWASLPAFLTAPDLLDELTRWTLARLSRKPVPKRSITDLHRRKDK
jgi:dienelactone hydrolase